tara:strand:+ start:119 stop:328 length:210 start_codon:yes stop_codon:yes gene_type:complete
MSINPFVELLDILEHLIFIQRKVYKSGTEGPNGARSKDTERDVAEISCVLPQNDRPNDIKDPSYDDVNS